AAVDGPAATGEEVSLDARVAPRRPDVDRELDVGVAAAAIEAVVADDQVMSGPDLDGVAPFDVGKAEEEARFDASAAAVEEEAFGVAREQELADGDLAAAHGDRGRRVIDPLAHHGHVLEREAGRAGLEHH